MSLLSERRPLKIGFIFLFLLVVAFALSFQIEAIGSLNFFSQEDLTHSLSHTLPHLTHLSPATLMVIPILVLSYNNGKYVNMMVDQLFLWNREATVWIIDNASTCPETRLILEQLHFRGCKVIVREKNEGHTVFYAADIQDALPPYYAVTDPDLRFHPDMPHDYLTTLALLTDVFHVGKAGLAIDISEPEKMYKSVYFDHKTIVEWERRFWTTRLAYPLLELYAAGVDTTFAVVNKRYHPQANTYNGLRVAGVYACQHMPWYPEYNHQHFTRAEIEVMYGRESGKISTIAKILLDDPFYSSSAAAASTKTKRSAILRMRTGDSSVKKT